MSRYLLGFVAAAAAGLSGCVILQGKSTAPGDDTQVDADALDQSDERLRLNALVEDGGLQVRGTVTVDDDKERAALDYENSSQTLEWDRRDANGCNCRTYVNEGFAVTVTFPTDRKGGRAIVKARAP